jgi:molybdenum cofactor guanylyltransferase
MRSVLTVPPHAQPISLADITGLVLAGGRGARMGGVDKGLQLFNGVPLTLHTLGRLQAQHGGPLGALMINANRNLEAYACFGSPVHADTLADFAGPLAGFLSGLAHATTPWLLTVPCDSPLFPLNLVQRLAQAALKTDADIAMVAAPESHANGTTQLRAQPVFCLLKTRLHGSLLAFTAQGGRKIDAWTAQHTTVLVPFDLPGDDPHAFANANTLAQLLALEQAAVSPAKNHSTPESAP